MNVFWIQLHRAILPKSQYKKDGSGSKDPYLVARFNLPPAAKRYLKASYSFSGATILLDKKFATFDPERAFATITENKTMTNTWRMFFEFIWDHLAN